MNVSVERLSFYYQSTPVLDNVTTILPEGKISVIIGPSGSGKSTFLRLLAGILTPHQGDIFFNGNNVSFFSPEERDIGVVFQNYSLFPHLTVIENIEFGLKTWRRRIPAVDRQKRAAEMLKLFNLSSLAGRMPSELSGGEQQRVALARAMAPKPALLLLDEPLSALDAQLRKSIRKELPKLLRSLGTTVFYVTHDQEEALFLADHLLILNKGRIEQEGSPLEIYRHPATPFVASFLGEANLLKGTWHRNAAYEKMVMSPAGRFDPMSHALYDDVAEGAEGYFLFRPEDLAIDSKGLPGTVVEARGVGPYTHLVVRLDTGEELTLHIEPGTIPLAGSSLRIINRPGRGHFLEKS